MDYKEMVKNAKEIDEKATPGPWMWDLRECNHQCLLTTTHSGKYYVMGFQRWGLQDALPSFQVYDRYDGPMKDRGSHGMVRADKLSKSYPGQEHHRGFDNFIDHPDARYIAESRQLFHLMAEAITDLLARAEAAEQKVNELERALSDASKIVNTMQESTIPFYRRRAEEAEADNARLLELVEADRDGRCVVVTRCCECENHVEFDGQHYCKFWRMYCPDDSEFYCKAAKDTLKGQKNG